MFTMENIVHYIGMGQFAATIRLLFGENPMSAYKHLHWTLSKFFSKKPEMMAFWHARLVYSILSLQNVNFLCFDTKKRVKMLVKWLLIAHNLELIPPMYLKRIVQILARNGIHHSRQPTGEYARGLAHAQNLIPLSPSIWGEQLQAIKQWSIFLHQNFGGIHWPSSISTVEEAEEFWGDYEGDLRHAIPAFTRLPCFINFPTTTCDAVDCLVEESVKLYQSAGKWLNDEVFLDRASTRLWATAFLHASKTSLLSVLTRRSLFQSRNSLDKILATSNFFNYILSDFVTTTGQVNLVSKGIAILVLVVALEVCMIISLST